MGGVLRSGLELDQVRLLRECFSVFDRDGVWPVWAYLDHVLDGEGLIAVDVLASLPAAGNARGAVRYGLTWNQDNHWLPNDGTPLALTVAGLWHLGTDTTPLLAAFTDTIRFMVDLQRTITPSPTHVTQATLTSSDLADHLSRLPAGTAYARKVASLAEHEAYLWRGVPQPRLHQEPWETGIPVSIRDCRQVTTAEEYIDTVERLATPPGLPAQPMTAAPPTTRST